MGEAVQLVKWVWAPYQVPKRPLATPANTFRRTTGRQVTLPLPLPPPPVPVPPPSAAPAASAPLMAVPMAPSGTVAPPDPPAVPPSNAMLTVDASVVGPET